MAARVFPFFAKPGYFAARVRPFFAKSNYVAARVLPFFTKPSYASERAFLPAALEIIETPASPTLRITAAVISACLLTTIVWSYVGHVDIVATAPGKVIVRARTKVVQPSATGEVREIDVADGDRVEAGQVLIKLDPTMSKADQARYGDVLLQAQLDQTRLRAELTPKSGDPFAGMQAPPDLLAATSARLEAEQSEQAAKLAKIDQEIAQKRAEQAEVEAQIAKIDAALPLVQKRTEIRSVGANNGYGSVIDYLQQQQQLVEMQNERVAQERKHDETVAALAALTSERAQAEAEFKRTAFTDLAKADRDIAEATSEVAKAARQTELQTLTAPVGGIVQDLAIHTLGGVVTPAQQLLRIVPTDGGIEVEAVVANQDVGFVEVGQQAEIKVDTFTFTRYGLIHGLVREIARDSVDEPQSEQRRQGSQSASDAPENVERPSHLVYMARIALQSTQMVIDGRAVDLAPGMAVTAEIKTGKRRLLDYLLSPFHRYSHDVMRER
jgi:hemolysin D